MALPLHTFELTGDPLVDHENYFRAQLGPSIDHDDWFERNPHVLSHLPSKIIRESVKFISDDRAPQDSGIYFLIDKENIVYVGKARNIYTRLEDHHWRSHKRFDRYWCFGGIPYIWLGQAEGYYIKQCKPFWNVAHVPYSAALDKLAKKHRQTWKVNEMLETGELILSA